MHYYQRDLAFIHDRGYGPHADRCAPGILELLSVNHQARIHHGKVTSIVLMSELWC